MNYIKNTLNELNNFVEHNILPENKSDRTALIVGLVALTILGPIAIAAAKGLFLACLLSPLAIGLSASLIYAMAKKKSEEKDAAKEKLNPIVDRDTENSAKDASSNVFYHISSSQAADPYELRINLLPGDPLIALREQALTGTLAPYTFSHE